MAAHSARSVLVVDDDVAINDMLTMFLEDEGYHVASAHDGAQALQQLRSSCYPPCVILLDLNMPVMTGWEFRHEQQRDPRLATIPVAIISADRSVRQQPRSIDAIDYFEKPIDLERLLTLIEQRCS
jgi:CheY-like chemotaxis protein